MLGKNTTRRNVLHTVGGSVAATGLVGYAAADPPEKVEVNVGYRGVSGQQLAADAAGDVVRDFEFDALSLRVPKQAVQTLRQRPDVRYVEPNGTMRALGQTLPWGVDRVDGEAAADCGATGAGADIAIVDTGIDSGHPDLTPNLGSGVGVVSCSGTCQYTWDDDNGHGTHVAGTAAAADNGDGVVGVAPEATLHAVKVLDGNGAGSYADVATGIQEVANRGWDVASISLGGGQSSTVADAVQYANNKGVLLAAAAGGSGPCTDCVAYPAAYPEVVAVSALNRYDELASFSSRGSSIELAAPGANINSTYLGGNYQVLSGTSTAVPHVSGAAALLTADGYSNNQARSRLQQTAENVGLSASKTGYGLVDAAAAVGCDSTDDL